MEEAPKARLGFLKHPAVPLLGCRGSPCWRMRGDHWLAGRYERRVLEALLRRALGSGLGVSGKLVVFHRIPAPHGEYAVEVFADAARLGVLEYAPGRGWLLHPSGAAASLAAASGARVVEVGAAPGRLKGKRLLLAQPCGGRRWVLLRAGAWAGPARVLGPSDGGCLVKVKDMAPLGMEPLEPAGLEEAIEANAEAVGSMAAEARRFIRRVYWSRQAGRGKLHVALSGGADSAAVLELAREAVGESRVVAVYVDTGMEHPETRRYVEKLASMLGVDLEVVEAEAEPLEEVARRGLMTRGDRWCTRLLKLEPLRRFYESRGVRLVLDGARWWESSSRARTPRLGVNPLLPGVIRALPIASWPRLAVQLYLAERCIPLNQLYDAGLVRIGCMACPAMHLYELHVSYRLHRGWFHALSEAVARHLGLEPGEALRLILSGSWRGED